jgi:hypothetical protein
MVRTGSGSGYGFLQCASTGCGPLNFDTSTGLFGGSTYTGTLAPFSRTIYLNKVQRQGIETQDTEVVITVEMKWRSGGTENVFKIRETLTNWKAEK